MGAFSNLSYLMIETNSTCNLACLSCNRSRLEEKGWRSAKNVSVQEWRKMLEVFKDCPLEMIKVEGLSEPMLHPEFDKLLQILREYFPKAFVIIATNLQYQFEKSPFLKSLAYVDMVYLSLDGIGDFYEKLRPPAQWSKAQKWLEAAKVYIPQTEREKKLHINFTVTEENVSQFEEIYKLKDEYHLASVRINLAQDWNGDRENSYHFGKSFLRQLEKYKTDVKGVAGWQYSDCFWPFEGLVVDVFGDVRQCVINTSQAPIGNIFKNDIVKLYNESQHYIDLRAKLGCNKVGKDCIHCDYHFLASTLETFFGGVYMQNAPRKFKK